MTDTLTLRSIMQAAWADYRRRHANKELIHGPRRFNRSEFAFRLQIAWANAKRAAMTSTERRRDRIETELARLDYKPARINIEPRRRELLAELATLAA